MLEVKPYIEKYKEDLREVCLNTAYSTAHEPKERNYLLNTYCDYYLECEPENCFAAVDENGAAQGYILCSEDYKKYKKNIRPYVSRARKSGIVKSLEGIGERTITALFSRRYPAHMHIDINPGFQRQGIGTKLVDALVNHLRSKGIKGVMLIVGTGNVKGMSFYKKYGFRRVLTIGEATVMALDLKG